MPELLGDRHGVQAARAAEGQQREVARVEALLDGHHPQRADHLGVGDPDHAGAPARPCALEPSDAIARRAAPASSATPPASGVPASSRPSTRFASVTVGSGPAAP
jgi:hypothetical protein